MRLLIAGDIIGKPGRRALRYMLKDYRQAVDLVIVNVENAAGGFGITKKVYEELKSMGVDLMTSGNHIWDKKEVFEFIDDAEDLLRPANYPDGVPGRGYGIFEKSGVKFALINLMGRSLLDSNLDNPFKTFDRIYQKVSKETNIILVDFHAETTSEKWAFGIYADGRASLVYGTHTHVPTADQVVLKHGTGYITDVGMSGCWYSAIGMKPKEAIERFLTGIPQKYQVEEQEDVVFNGILVEIDPFTGKTTAIERLQRYIKREELLEALK
ncbi:MAG: TIGR00282 family metallophosphoesterase [Hydrogenobacter thermophilus]|uniref:TIGR00282 family metallophosphoesterase n=1 Tax=Hydrogenobacter thermophilus TaxID=940 RepID=UPI001C74DA99|nr:TIGR00282 family metallophosphoesterase [Hydrogenobacter thermophilus]QWK19422.1 MAG: TIGR00282 family metallophosphoesterase [Hydrogenobacter thermophilus]